MAIKYCPACGAELDPDTQFCSSCGADLREREPKAESEPPKTVIATAPQQAPLAKPTTVSDMGVKYGEFLERLIAIIIDGIIIGIITLILSFIIDWFWANLLGFVIGLLYFWLLEANNNGQTLGKMAMKLRTVNEKTLETATIGEYLINNLFKGHIILLFIDFIIGILTNSGDPKRRLRIMQNASNTVVIKI
jgi:uncharacterized RDD family membrane protein YckC